MVVDQKSLLNFRRIIDFVIINLTFIFAAVLAQPVKELISNQLLFILLLLQNILWFFSSGIINTYYDFNFRSFSDQIINVIKLVIIEVIFTIFFLFFIKEDLFTRNFVGFYGIILFIFLSAKEYIIWSVLNNLRAKGRNLRNLLIIGYNEVSRQFREELSANPEFGFKFIGYIDDEVQSDEKVLGKTEELENILTEYDIKDVVYSYAFENSEVIKFITRVCDKHAVKLTILPHLTQFSNSNIEISFLGNFPVLRFRRNKLGEFQWRIVKRTFDFLFTLVSFILVLWWVFLGIGVAIKLTSKGKVFFIQERIGRHGNHFKCYKFRIMRETPANDEDKITDDSERVTKVGSILRKYSLDELPQFINVMKGDMSVVGPRPHAVSFDTLYSEMVEEIKLRHRVKPGITGWAQVHGLRGDVFDFEENKIRTKKRIDFDNWYIENWSFKLDIQIIIETVWQIITGRNLGS